LSEHRSAELVQRRKRHLQLGLDSLNLNKSTARRLASALVHQGGLADSGLTPQHEDRALTLTKAVQHAVQH
jgi:DNA-binding IclR family transcriptional regulator